MAKRAAPVLVLCAAVLGEGALVGAAPARFRGAERELCELYLAVIEEAVDVFEPLWTEDPSVPNAGFFDFRKYGNWCDAAYPTIIVIPGTGMVLLDYAILLTETDRKTFGKRRLPRQVMLERAVKAIRWCCLTSVYVESPYAYLPGVRGDFRSGKKWRRRLGYRADELGYLTLAVAVLWEHLDPETQGLFRAVAAGGAARTRLVRTWTPGQAGNHDQVKQDLSSTFGAAFLSDDPEARAGFLAAVAGNGIDMVSTLQDRTKTAIAEGKPVKDWAEGWNLHQDYSSDHHGHAIVWYGGDMLFEGRSYLDIIAHVTGKRVPETFTYDGNGFDGVLGWLKALCLADGGLAHPHGAEYDSYYGAGLLAFCYGATVKKDRVAAALEQRTARLLARHSRAVGQYDYHRGSWAKAAMAYLMHKHHAPSAAPLDLDTALASLSGTAHYPRQRCLTHRTSERWASFSWGSTSSRRTAYGFCGMVVPQDLAAEDPDPLVYSHEHSLTGTSRAKGGTGGRVAYEFTRSDDSFSTAGVVVRSGVEHRQAFFSFGDGPCVTFVVLRPQQDGAVSWSGLPAYLYVRPGFTCERTCSYAGGTAPVSEMGGVESAWWCVNDRIGMATIGGTGGIRGGRSVGYNWARKSSYKDKCDFVVVSPVDGLKATARDPAVDLTAAVYVNRPADHVRDCAARLRNLSPQLPDGWRGAVAPVSLRGTARVLALANLYGQKGLATLRLGFPEGAPVLEQQTTIAGSKASAEIRLAPLESSGQMLDWYVQADAGTTLLARKTAFDRIELRTAGGDSGRVRITYLGKKANRFVFLDGTGREIEAARFPRAGGSLSIDWRLSRRLVIQAVGEEVEDRLGPAVEIASLEHRGGGQLTIRVAADDRSGIRKVALYCDDSLIGERPTPPFEWTCERAQGWHTFRAVATDASPSANVATSSPRTTRVERVDKQREP